MEQCWHEPLALLAQPHPLSTNFCVLFQQIQLANNATMLAHTSDASLPTPSPTLIFQSLFYFHTAVVDKNSAC